MSEATPSPILTASRADQPGARARVRLLKRLTDVVCLPASRVNAFERAMTADLLVELLREASLGERERVARRLTVLNAPPGPLVRLLLRDELSVARPLLVDAATLSDADLIACLYQAGPEHRRLIAQRRGVGEVVTDALIELDEEAVAEALLRNDLAQLSHHGVEHLVAASRDAPRLIPLLLRRAELRPSHAYVLFWWADAETRRGLLQRFALTREILREAIGDVLEGAAGERWEDPLALKALRFVAPDQRNPAAVDKSPYASLDAAVAAAEPGLTRETADEISYLCGLKPVTGAKIFADRGGEPLAILCKATGLPRSALRALWRGLVGEPDRGGAADASLERALDLYDALAVDQAQTVLRYWDAPLTSGLTPALLKAIREGDESAVDEYSAPQRAALLALSRDFGR